MLWRFTVFEGRKFLLGEDADERCWCEPFDIMIDDPWEKTGLSSIVDDIGLYALSNIYEKDFGPGSDIYRDFCQFLRSMGCCHTLTIRERSQIPREIKVAMRNYGKCTRHQYEVDHVIDGLENILSNITFEKSLLIWECLLNSKGREHKCSYKPNASSPITSSDSTFIRQLKEAAWLPDKDGDFHKPREITINNLHDKFIYKESNSCIEALGIGADAKDQENKCKQEAKQREEQDIQAREEGFASQNEKEDAIQLIKELRSNGISVKEIREKVLPKYNKPEFPQRPVTDPNRRKQKIKERAQEASTKIVNP